MKKVILSAILAAGVFAANAQTSQGTLSIGGQIGFSSNSSSTEAVSGGTTVTTDGPTNTSFAILPAAQYFIIDKFSIGLQVGYTSTSQKQKFANGNETTNTTGAFQIAPFARYYFMLDEKVGFFGQAAVPLAFGGTKNETKSGGVTASTEGTYSSFGFQLSPGFIFFPSKNIGLEASLGNVLGIQTSSTKYDNSGTTTTYSSSQLDLFNINTLSFNLGLSYYFGK